MSQTKLECGCKVTAHPPSINYCPAHGAGPELLKRVLSLFRNLPSGKRFAEEGANSMWFRSASDQMATAWAELRSCVKSLDGGQGGEDEPEDERSEPSPS